MLFGDLSCFSLCLACLLLLAFLFSCFCMCVLYNIIGLPFSFAFCLVCLFFCFRVAAVVACFVSLFACSLVSLAFVFALIVCDCFRALFGQSRARKRQSRQRRTEERRQGNARRACPALPDCLCYRCIIYHYARTYAAGVYRPAPGGTFSVRFAGKNQPNRSCSSPQPIVLTTNQRVCTIF